MQPNRPICRRVICLAAVALLGTGTRLIAAQTPTGTTIRDEQAIRSLIRQENDGKRVIKYTDEAIYVSGAYPRPAVGRNQLETMSRDVMSKGSNVSLHAEPLRLVISKSRDLAYEYSNFRMSFDDPDGKKITLTGSYLRVWRKVAGRWKVDAFFAKPNEEGQ